MRPEWNSFVGGKWENEVNVRDFIQKNYHLMHFSYARYLENKIREGFGFEGTSIKFVFREKGEKEE